MRSRRGLERLPGLALPSAVAVMPATELRGPLPGLVIAAPAQSVRTTLTQLRGIEPASVLSAAKGLEHATGARMSSVIAETWPSVPVSVLSGPNLSQEVVRGAPTAAVIACTDSTAAVSWQQALSGGSFRTYTSSDTVGVELAGALKNVVAIAAGVAWGLGFGANTVAALMTRGLAEITRLGVALGAQPETFLGLAGVGDLSATCFSPLSRNRQLGERLARGQALQEALSEIGQVVEGAATAPVAVRLATSAGVQMPVARHVAATLEGLETVGQAMGELLERPLTTETG